VLLSLAFAFASAMALPATPRSDLASDEELRLFPALAYPTPTGWEVHIGAWVYEPERSSWWRELTLRALRKALGLPSGSERNALFRERARPFLADNERRKRIVLGLRGESYSLPPTTADGHTQALLPVPAAALSGPVTPIAARLRSGDERSFSAPILRMDRGGVSVISDIDDTVKISEVGDLRALLSNTFLRPYVAVPELAAIYRGWAHDGALFHYVSASPWQLYDPLRQFLEERGFPGGSFHLKRFRWLDRSFLSLLQDPYDYKVAAVDPLLRGSPERAFVLVGDSGERDPEAYADTYRRHPDQVAHIYIRDVTGEAATAPRYQTTFAGVPIDRWTIFRDPQLLPSRLSLAAAASRRDGAQGR